MEKIIKVVLCKAGKEAQIVKIPNELEDLQETVGGLIEPIPAYEDAVIICNEEGRIRDLPFNRYVYDEDGDILTDIHGDFFICGHKGEDFASLDYERLRKYYKMFRHPEIQFRGILDRKGAGA